MQPKTTEELTTAFEKDGYYVDEIKTYEGRRGILARSKTAVNYDTGERKMVLYVEGNAYQRGFLIGLLASDKIERMVSEYVDNVVLSLLGIKCLRFRFFRIKRLLMNLLKKRCVATYDRDLTRSDFPEYLRREMKGIAAGCKTEKDKTKVNYEELMLLNVGIDFLLAKVYTGGAGRWDWLADVDDFFDRNRRRPKLFQRIGKCLKRPIKVKPTDFKAPVMCNGFALHDGATADGNLYYGRDFMFASAKVFQDTACMIIYNPIDPDPDEDGTLPVVAVTAPGFVGSVTAMNSNGFAAGVQVVTGQNCEPRRPGLNSLPMVRHCAGHAKNCDQAVELMARAQRGVTWIYHLADASTNRSCAVEAGKTTEVLDYLRYPTAEHRKLLPNADLPTGLRGLFPRWNDYTYPSEMLDYNPALFNMYNKPYNASMVEPLGRFSTVSVRPWDEKAVPDAFYFPPQREERSDVLISVNQYIIPALRICSMGSWASFLNEPRENDGQWRYDELNGRLLEALGERGGTTGQIDWQTARDILDFLSPDRDFPEYYEKLYKSRDGKRTLIQGSKSLCNLNEKIMESYFGYYGDKWVRISLSEYVD